MVSLIIVLLSLFLVLCFISLIKLINFLPERELKRRNDKLSVQIRQLVFFKSQIETLLYIIISILSAISIILIVKVTSTITGIVLIVLLFLLFVGLVRTKVNKFIKFFGKLFLGVMIKIVYRLNKKNILNKKSKRKPHTGIYDLNDIDELIETQLTQEDNRILKDDLTRIKNLINLEKYSSSSFIIDKDYFPLIEPKDLITPIIIDEVKKADRPFLPVTLNGEIVGVVSEEIFSLNNVGHIEDFMETGFEFVSSHSSIMDVLRHFISSKKDYLIVQDEYNNYLGLIYLRDLVNWIFVLEV
jgi:CBS domain containing-hemolysin-like protein